MYTGCLSLQVGFRRSALDMGKVRAVRVQEEGASKWGIWRETGWVIEAEDSTTSWF